MARDREKFRAYQRVFRRSVMGRYVAHRANAQARGIPFLLTFEQWTTIWNESGKWDQRGSRRGQYCMARPGDKGAYEVGNVVIILNEDNRAERNRLNPMKGEANPAFGKNYWSHLNDEAWKRHSDAIRKANSKPKSQLTRERMSVKATGRRRVIRDGHLSWSYPGDSDYPK